MIPTNPSYKDLGIITPDDLNFSKLHRITNVWNALPYSVANAPNVKLFNENLLDMHLFNYLRGRTLI